MCIACELGFWNMIDALPEEARERIFRQQRERADAARFACDPAPEAAAPPAAGEPKPSEKP
jgi:hypothetical protein